MDFISQESLTDVLREWPFEKQRTLGEILVERGLLAAESRELLEPLIDAHIEQHGGDAELSLVSLSSDAGIIASLGPVDDAELQASLSLLPVSELESASSVGAVSTALPLPNEDCGQATLGELPTAPGVDGDGVTSETLNEPDSAGTLDEAEHSPGAVASDRSSKRAKSGQRFRIIRPHAEGGLGRVFVAVDQELNREVAFKDIKPQHARRKDAQSRFVVEAEVTGGLEHPGIVPVYGLGHFPDGRPFYAMRFVRGESLHDAIREFHAASAADGTKSSPMSTQGVDFTGRAFRDLLNRLIDVCNAMQYAHDRKVLHRDLKPGNIMLGKYGETLVVDWGLAKATGKDVPRESTAELESPIVPASGSQSAPTMDGSTIGTPAYMPPEQAEGRIDELGPASDVYSLGATLYEILAGERPLRRERLPELLKRVREGDVPPTRSINPHIPAALDAICQRAMALCPVDRYESAKALADDLEAWLADEPVSAFAEPLAVRARRWIRRHPALVSASVAGVLMTLVGLSVLSAVVTSKNEALTESEARATAGEELATQNAATAELQRDLARSARTRAEVNEARAIKGEQLAEEQRKRAEQQLYLSQTIRAVGELKANRYVQAARLLATIPLASRHWETRYLARKAQGTPLILRGHLSEVTGVDWSSDGKLIASSGMDKTIRVWDAATGETVRTLRGHEDNVNAVAVSPDATLIASASSDGTARLWDVSTGNRLLTCEGHEEPVLCVCFSPDGNTIATGSEDGTARIWDVQSGKELQLVKAPGREPFFKRLDDVKDIRFNVDGTQLVSVREGSAMLVSEVSTGMPLAEFGRDPDDERGTNPFAISKIDQRYQYRCLSISPDGTQIASGIAGTPFDLPGRATVWNAKSRAWTLTLPRAGGTLQCVSFSPDGRWIASAGGEDSGDSGDLTVWGASTGNELFTLRGHSGLVSSVCFSPDGTRIVSGSHDSTIRVWDSTSRDETMTLRLPSREVFTVHFSPDGRQIVSSSAGETHIWDAASGEEIRIRDRMSGSAFVSGGKQIVSRRDNELILWDATDGKDTLTIRGHSGDIQKHCISTDGSRIASSSGDGTVRIWDANSGRELTRLTGQMKEVYSLALAPNGEQIAGGSHDEGIAVWKVAGGNEMFRVSDLGFLGAIRYSTDGNRIACGTSPYDSATSNSGTVGVWDSADGGPQLLLSGHSNSVRSVAFSPDDQRIVSAGDDETVRIWNGESGEEMLVLHGHTGIIWSTEFSSDGRRIVSGGGHTRATSDGSLLAGTDDESGETMVWDSLSSEETLALVGHSERVASASFSRDETRIISKSESGRVIVWDAATGNRLEGKAPEELTERTSTSDGVSRLFRSGRNVILVRKLLENSRRLWAEDHARRIVQAPAWHEQSALQAEKEKDWFAAVFHLRLLSKLKPDDNSFRERIANAEALLAD